MSSRPGPASSIASTTRRLMRERAAYESDPNPSLTFLEPVSDADLLHWRAGLKGVHGSPYEGGVWTLHINIPDNYPLAPPDVAFATKVCHPNVHFKTGEVCLDLLKTAWSAAYTLSATMTAIQTLLTSPEPDSPLNVDAAALFRADEMGYDSLVKYYTWRYAVQGPGGPGR